MFGWESDEGIRSARPYFLLRGRVDPFVRIGGFGPLTVNQFDQMGDVRPFRGAALSQANGAAFQQDAVAL